MYTSDSQIYGIPIPDMSKMSMVAPSVTGLGAPTPRSGAPGRTSSPVHRKKKKGGNEIARANRVHTTCLPKCTAFPRSITPRITALAL